MAIYRKGEGLWSRGVSSAIVFAIALFGCRSLAGTLDGIAWGRRVLAGGLTLSWVVSGALLAACAAGLWVLMNHAKAVDFLVDMESELRKVSWPVDPAQPKFSNRYRELIQSSTIVIMSVLVMGVALFLFDAILGRGVHILLGTAP